MNATIIIGYLIKIRYRYDDIYYIYNFGEIITCRLVTRGIHIIYFIKIKNVILQKLTLNFLFIRPTNAS